MTEATKKKQRGVIVVPQDPDHVKIASALKWGKDKGERGPRGTKDQLDLLKLLSELLGKPEAYEDALKMLAEDPYGPIDGWGCDNKTSKTDNLYAALAKWHITVPDSLGAKYYTQTLWDDKGHLWWVGAVARATVIERRDELERAYDNKLQFPIRDSMEPWDFVDLLKKGG